MGWGVEEEGGLGKQDNGRDESVSVSLLLRSNEMLIFNLLTVLCEYITFILQWRETITLFNLFSVIMKINILIGRSFTMKKILLKDPEFHITDFCVSFFSLCSSLWF